MMFDGDEMDNGAGAEETAMPPVMPTEGGDMGGDDSTGDESTDGGM